jgi:hypothetical protein
LRTRQQHVERPFLKTPDDLLHVPSPAVLPPIRKGRVAPAASQH